MIADNVKKVFDENLWYVATCGEYLNVIPVGFKCVTDDGKFAMAAVMMSETCANIQANGKIAVNVCNPTTLESYQVKGTAEFVTEGPVYDAFVKLCEDTFKGAMSTKCAVVITPAKIINNGIGPNNGQEVEF